jgi:transcriptional regulator with XRE-family HTH domain
MVRRARKSKKPQRGLYARRVLARNVFRLRKARKMNQEELADAANLSQPQISEIEGAKTNIRLHVVQSLATGLSVRLADLFEESQ